MEIFCVELLKKMQQQKIRAINAYVEKCSTDQQSQLFKNINTDSSSLSLKINSQ